MIDRFFWWFNMQPQFYCYRSCETFFDFSEDTQHTFTDGNCFNLSEFKCKRVNDMLLFRHRLAIKKQTRLAEMIKETFTALADFMCINLLRMGNEPSLHFTCLE